MKLNPKLNLNIIGPINQISKERKMPYKYLSQIAPVLVDAGILGSKEGVGGGYYLKKKPESISVGEVLELLEGPMAPVACMRDGCQCEPHCVQKSMMKKVATSVREAMEGYTLADLT